MMCHVSTGEPLRQCFPSGVNYRSGAAGSLSAESERVKGEISAARACAGCSADRSERPGPRRRTRRGDAGAKVKLVARGSPRAVATPTGRSRLKYESIGRVGG